MKLIGRALTIRSVVLGGAALLACPLTSAGARAAEIAAGAYLLGLRGPGAGVTPPEGLYLNFQTYFYSGNLRANVPLEGGTLVAKVKLTPAIAVPTFQWITPIDIGGVRLGVSLTAPVGNAVVSAEVGPVRRKDSLFAFADPSVSAFLGWRTGDLHWQAGVTAFLPIGDYRRGALANVSKNRGALDAYAALTWLEPNLGLDVTNVVGVTFNRTNGATDYRTGKEFHWEWAVTKKFEGGVSIGPVGYIYSQLSGDTGPGAKIGPFKGYVAAVGGTIGYDFKLGVLPVSARVRYYHELKTENRLKGDAVFVSISMPLWVAGAK
jgi:hypothetical protein